MPTCYKSKTNPSCIDLILTNKPTCFQNSCVFQTGLSDFHLLTLTVLKSKSKKAPPKIVSYRDYKKYDHLNCFTYVHSHLSSLCFNDFSFDDFNALLLKLFDNFAPFHEKGIT